MERFPDEAAGARDAPASPGQPRGAQQDPGTTPQETRRAARAPSPERVDESSGDRVHAPLAPIPSVGAAVLAPWDEHPEADLDATAQALADAFLAAERWEHAALVRTGTDVVGPRPELLGVAAAVALERFPDAPRDAPRAFARALAGSVRFGRAFEEFTVHWPVRLQTRRLAPTVAREPAPALPRVDTVADLARLLGVTVGRLEWFADTGGWNRRATSEALHHYRYRWLERPGRTPRLLEAPRPMLRQVQRLVLAELLTPLPVHDAAHGFVPGRSAVTGAALHTGREVVLGADLVSCFAAVRAGRVYGVFRDAGLPERVAHLLAGVTTHAVPHAVLRAMPPGGSVDERRALADALARPHLPQGAPSSPALANLTLARLDARLTGWAAVVDATYTRYADDLAFSGDAGLASRPDAFLRGVARIVADEGHRLNDRKTRVRRRGVRQSVTGVVVNDRVGPGRREYDALKALLHNCARHGAASQNRHGHPEFRAHLAGRIAWVTQLHPERGAKLQERFDRIAW